MCEWRSVCVGLVLTLGVPMVARAQNFQDLYNFAGGTGDGAKPTGSLIDVGGILYGMTPKGGAYFEQGGGDGTIFSFNPANGQECLLYSFGGFMGDGIEPLGSFVRSSGDNSVLLGLTSGGYRRAGRHHSV